MKSLTKYYMRVYTGDNGLIGVLVEAQGNAEFIWNIHPFDWYRKPEHLIIDEYGNTHTQGDFRDMLLRTRSWNLANVGRVGPLNGPTIKSPKPVNK